MTLCEDDDLGSLGGRGGASDFFRGGRAGAEAGAGTGADLSPLPGVSDGSPDC